MLLSLVAAPSVALGAEPVEPERSRLLAEHLERASSLAAMEPYLPAIGGAACTAGAVGLGLAESHELRPSRAAVMAPAVGCAVVSFGSYALPREYQGSVGFFSFVTAAAAPLAMFAISDPYLPDAERVTMLGLVGGMMSLGTLRLVDALIERPVSWTSLRADARELRARGAEVTGAELGRMESDLRRATVRPVPRWAYGVGILLGGLVSLSPLFVASTSSRDRAFAATFGAIGVLNGSLNLSFALAVPNGYDRYVAERSGARLSPVGPSGAAGLWVGGAF